jgi:lipid-A-disaccharide synthase
MLIAGEASGDALGAELVLALRKKLEPERTAPGQFKFLGVGGPQMQAAGVEVIFDFTRNAVWGLEALKQLFEFRRRFKQLLRVAIERQPDAIICIDFAGFNRRFAQAVKKHLSTQAGSNGAGPWSPRIVQYVSPQVWASRPRRADSLAQAVDLLLTIFPFEKAWYAGRVPALPVTFVGHPMIDRYANKVPRSEKPFAGDAPSVVLLPGSRPTELKRHLPIMLETLQLPRQAKPAIRPVMVLSKPLADLARQLGLPSEVKVQADLAEALREADLAIAKSGTVTLECAYFGVPAVIMYQTSALTYAIGKRIVNVKWVAMPNILANEEVLPEFLQNEATAANIGRAALELLNDAERRNNVKAKLRQVAASLGLPGASRRAAEEILGLLEPRSAASSGVREQT